VAGCLAVFALAGTVTLVEAAGGSAVVANRGSGTISVIDAQTDTATTVALPAGAVTPEPMYVAYSAPYGRVFVGDRANNRVAVFDAGDFSVETTAPTGAGVFHMWASDNVDQLWVVNDIDNTITVIDTVTLDVLDTVPLPADLVSLGGKPHDVIIDPTAPFAYLSMLGFASPADYVVKYSTTTFMEVDRQVVGKDPHLSLARQNSVLYVPCQNSNAVYVLDRDTLAFRPNIFTPGAHGAGMTRNGKVFYTTNLPGGGTDGLVAIDTRTNTVSGSWDTPFSVPHNIALTPNGKKIYVTHSGATADHVSIFETRNKKAEPKLTGSVTVGLNPFGIAFVP
jgi:DNA-binding beta-propeller fold protein YncE